MSIFGDVLSKLVDAASMFWQALVGPERWVFVVMAYLLCTLVVAFLRRPPEREIFVLPPPEAKPPGPSKP